MSPEEALKRWPDSALERYKDPAKERERRRQLSIKAKERHGQVVDSSTDQRVFGGPQPGSGRPRKATIAEQVVEMAEGKKNKQLLKALFSGLDPNKNTPAQRVRTAEKIIKITQKQKELEIRELDFKDDPREALIAFIAPALAKAIKNGKLQELADVLGLGDDENTVEGTVVGEDRSLPA